MPLLEALGNGSSGGSTTIAQVMTKAVPPGAKIIAYLIGGATTTNIIQGVSDSINGSAGWVQVAGSSAAESGGPTSCEVWVQPNSAAGAAPTITATFKVSQTFRAIIIHVVSALDPTEGAAALASARSQITVANFTTANITTLVGGCYIFGGCSNDIDSTVPTAGGAFVLEATTATQVCGSEDQIQASAGAIAASFNFSAAKSGVVNVVAFKPLVTAIPFIQEVPYALDIVRNPRARARRNYLALSSINPVVPPVTSVLARRTLHQMGNRAGRRDINNWGS